MLTARFETLRVGPSPINECKSRRYEWYAFVRAHQSSIEWAHKRLAGTIKIKNTVEQQNWATKINSLDAQYDAVLRYEVILDIDLEQEDAAYLIFRDKSVRTQPIAEALNAIGAPHQTIEQMLTGADSFASPETEKAVVSKIMEARMADIPQPDISEWQPTPGPDFDQTKTGKLTDEAQTDEQEQPK